MPVTRTNRARNTAKAALSTLVSTAHAPVHDVGEQRGQRHPGELIPVEEREAEQKGLPNVVERHDHQADERQQQQKTYHALSSPVSEVGALFVKRALSAI